MIEVDEEEFRRKTGRQVARSLQQIEAFCDEDVTEEELKRSIKHNFWTLFQDTLTDNGTNPPPSQVTEIN